MQDFRILHSAYKQLVKLAQCMGSLMWPVATILHATYRLKIMSACMNAGVYNA